MSSWTSGASGMFVKYERVGASLQPGNLLNYAMGSEAVTHTGGSTVWTSPPGGSSTTGAPGNSTGGGAGVRGASAMLLIGVVLVALTKFAHMGYERFSSHA